MPNAKQCRSFFLLTLVPVSTLWIEDYNIQKSFYSTLLFNISGYGYWLFQQQVDVVSARCITGQNVGERSQRILQTDWSFLQTTYFFSPPDTNVLPLFLCCLCLLTHLRNKINKLSLKNSITTLLTPFFLPNVGKNREGRACSASHKWLF